MQQPIPATPEQRRPTSIKRVVTFNRNEGTVEEPRIVGTDFTLVFDFSAIATLEDLYDCPLKDLGEKFKDTSSLRIRDVQRMLYAGLRTHHPEVTLERTLAILNEAVGAGTSVGELLSETFAAFDASAGPDGKPGAGETTAG